ncbi:MAG: flagellar export chaperone FliS [Pseudomonadota bacterium]
MNRKTSAATEYGNLGLRTNIESSNPHRLILLLLDGAVEKICLARAALANGDISAKGSAISLAISIIDGLRASLAIDEGHEIAQNLDDLYEFSARTLLEANLDNDETKLNQVIEILGEIRAGWVGIEQTARQTYGEVTNEVGSISHALG